MGRSIVALVVLGMCSPAAAQDAEVVIDGDESGAGQPDAPPAEPATSSERSRSSEATAVPDAAAPDVLAFGLQLAADGTFTEPALTPQVGFVLHIRLPEMLSLRVVPSIGYVRMESQPPSSRSEPRWDDDRIMAELRVGLGYMVTPWLEGRLFVAARTIHRLVAFQGAEYAHPRWPVVEVAPGWDSYWVHRIAVSGGTEWTLRPIQSSGFEITASLGLGGIGTVLYNPYDGSPRFNMNAVHAHGALALGWLFDV